MEILVIIVAFCLVVVGGYGALALRRGGSFQRGSKAAPRVRIEDWESHGSEQRATPLGGLFSEVDLLRAQVEHLRTEVVALSDVAAQRERPRTRRYNTGIYAELPRMLRRHVKAARIVRHPISA